MIADASPITTELTGLDTARWLAERGGRFCKVAAWDEAGDWCTDPGKQAFPKNWQNTPLTVEQITPHFQTGGNVGLLTGLNSSYEVIGYLCILDVDESYSEFEALFDWVKDSPAIVRNGADRRKLLVQVIGDPPASQSFKRYPTAPKPFFEVLSTGRQGVIAGRHPSGTEYRLVNAGYGIPIFTPEGINAICETWAGQSLKVFKATQQQERQAQAEATRQHGGNGLLDQVLEYWTPLKVFEKFGRAGEVRQKGSEIKLRGNGGLYVNGNRWYCFADEQGGGAFEAWLYCKTGNSATLRGREFVDLLHEMAKAAGIPIPERKNGSGHRIRIEPSNEEARLPLPVVIEALQSQEQGDAKLFAMLYAGRVVYDHAEGEWYIWQGGHWRKDITKQVRQFMGNTVAAAYLYAAGDAQAAGDKELASKLAHRADRLRTRTGRENALDWANSLPGIALTGEEWDNGEWLLPCENGIIDLRTGELREEKPDDYIRTWIPVTWKGLNEPAPRWEQFQLEIHDGDAEIVAFKARLHGKTISGQIKERVFPILYGEEGQNGKGTELELYGKILGHMAGTAMADVLMDNRSAGDRPKPFLYTLRGKRFVWTKESKEGQRIDTGLVKALSGGDTISARENYMKRDVTFPATHTVYLMTNHKPHIPNDDEAMWKRVVLIPYVFSFVDNPTKPNERKADRDLLEKLYAERSGVLAWLVRGCLEWQRTGLNIPDSLRAETDEYRKEEDELGMFESMCCYIGSNARMGATESYQAYKNFCESMRSSPMSGPAYFRKMKKRHDHIRHGTGVIYLGIGLLSADHGTRV